MKKTAVIVCSNAALDYIEHPYNIPIFRSVIIFGDEKYDDFTELKADDFYERLKNDKSSFPHTAFVSIGHMIETFEDLKKQGYDSVLVIVISSALSGLSEGVKLASQEIEDFEVVVYDSKTLAYPEAYMALEAARMFAENETMENVLKRLDHIRDNNHIIFAVDTLEYLIKNGRLSKVAGAFAQMLAIRPLLEIDAQGKVQTLDKTRTSKKARELMIKKFLQEIEGQDIIPFISHANAPQEVIEDVRNKVLSVKPELGTIKDYLLTPVVGAHSGPGAMCLGWIKK